jgi:hypothetical protein
MPDNPGQVEQYLRILQPSFFRPRDPKIEPGSDTAIEQALRLRVVRALRQCRASMPTRDIAQIKEKIQPAWAEVSRYVCAPANLFDLRDASFPSSLNASLAYFEELTDVVLAYIENERRDPCANLPESADLSNFVAALSYILSALGRDALYRGGQLHCISISQAFGQLSAFVQNWDEAELGNALRPHWDRMDAELEKIRRFVVDFVTYTKLISSVRAISAELCDIVLSDILC